MMFLTENFSTPAGGYASRGRRARDECAHDWRLLLPRDWRDQVIAPLRITVHREYEMAAWRCIGYDEDERPCYYAHHFVVPDTRSDDDEEFYSVVDTGERVHGWRMRDQRWLIYRVLFPADDESPQQGFFSFSVRPPR